MAITVTKYPSSVVPAKNQCDIEVSTDAYISVAGTKAERILEFPKLPTTGLLTIANSLVSQDFTFETSPDNSGLQLPRNVGTLNETDFASVIIASLLNNYFIRRDYEVAFVSFTTGFFRLKFTAINKGISYSLISSSTVTGISLISNTAGVDKAVQPNFSIYMDVFAEQNYGQQDDAIVFSAEGVPDSNNKVAFNLQRILQAITGYVIPSFISSAVFIAAGPKRFYCKFLEIYGTPPIPKKYLQWPITNTYITALHGASQNAKYPFVNYASDYYLTTMPSEKIILHPKQKQFLTVKVPQISLSPYTILRIDLTGYDAEIFSITIDGVVKIFRFKNPPINPNDISPNYFGDFTDDWFTATVKPVLELGLGINWTVTMESGGSDYVIFKIQKTSAGKIAVDKGTVTNLTVLEVVSSLDFKIKGKLYYSDGSNSGSFTDWVTAPPDIEFEYTTIACGYEQLDLASKKAIGKTVLKYELLVFGNDETFTFWVEQNAQRNPRFFLFINSYGFPETVYFYGTQQRSIAFDTTTVQRDKLAVDAPNGIVHGEFDETNSEYQRTYKITTGNKDKTHIDYFTDFISSPARYEQRATQWVKVIMEKATIDIDSDDDTLYALNFSYKEGNMERGNA